VDFRPCPAMPICLQPSVVSVLVATSHHFSGVDLLMDEKGDPLPVHAKGEYHMRDVLHCLHEEVDSGNGFEG
jgi:hypothetical protein